MNAVRITRTSKSNLALAFVSLGRERRRDMTTFYAFCRLIDDVADTGSLTTSQKQEQLDRWRSWIRKPASDEPSPAGDLRALLSKHQLSPEMLDEIIDGVEMDLHKSTYATFEELRDY